VICKPGGFGKAVRFTVSLAEQPSRLTVRMYVWLMGDWVVFVKLPKVVA
jgi:hypothetical protein